MYHAAHHLHPREKGVKMEADSQHVVDSGFETDVVNLQIQSIALVQDERLCSPKKERQRQFLAQYLKM